MTRSTHIFWIAAVTLIFALIFSSTPVEAKSTVKVAVELFSGFMQEGNPQPPLFPDMWMINYPRNVYYAPDADKLILRDFTVESLKRLGSYRIVKRADDDVMFINNKKTIVSDKGWEFDMRGHVRLGRQLDRTDNFIHRQDGRDMYSFTVQDIIQPTVLYCFRPDTATNEVLFVFFSYTLHENFPKVLLQQFPPEDGFVTLGFNPFNMKFPTPTENPRLIFKAEAEYPVHLKRMKRTDRVEMMVLVDRDGTVSRVELVKKARYTPFDDSAMDAAFRSFYEPAKDSTGKTIPAWIEFNVDFTLDQ